jgi:hypothetical protein
VGFNFHNFLVAKSTVCYFAKYPLGGTGVGGALFRMEIYAKAEAMFVFQVFLFAGYLQQNR